MHGQELSAELTVRKGERKPGPGTIFLHLNLKEMGYIFDKEKEGKTITCKLTPIGEEYLKQSKRRFTRTFFGLFP